MGPIPAPGGGLGPRHPVGDRGGKEDKHRAHRASAHAQASWLLRDSVLTAELTGVVATAPPASSTAAEIILDMHMTPAATIGPPHSIVSLSCAVRRRQLLDEAISLIDPFVALAALLQQQNRQRFVSIDVLNRLLQRVEGELQIVHDASQIALRV